MDAKHVSDDDDTVSHISTTSVDTCYDRFRSTVHRPAPPSPLILACDIPGCQCSVLSRDERSIVRSLCVDPPDVLAPDSQPSSPVKADLSSPNLDNVLGNLMMSNYKHPSCIVCHLYLRPGVPIATCTCGANYHVSCLLSLLIKSNISVFALAAARICKSCKCAFTV